MRKETLHGLVSFVVFVATLIGLLLGFGKDSVIRNRRVITAVGLAGDESSYSVSVQAIEALKTAGNLAEQTENATTVYTAKGESVAAVFKNFLSSSGNRAYVLQNQLLVIDEELCKTRSLFVILDYFMRNAESNPSVKVVVFRGDPAELLAVTSGSEAIAATALTRLVEEGNRWGVCINSTLLDVERSFSGMYDVALPLIVLNEQTPTLCGTALFSSGEWAGTLSMEQTTGLLAAGDKLQKTVWNTKTATFELDEVKTKTRVIKQEKSVKYTFSLSGTVKLLEETKALTAKQRDELLRQTEKELNARMQEALYTTEVMHCDVLGLTRRAQQQYPRETTPSFEKCPKEIQVTLRFADRGFFLS